MFLVAPEALDREKQQRVANIVEDLRKRMLDLDKLGDKVRRERIYVSPQRTKQLLEEIKVPPLKLLK
ncbi:MAG: hypothetical protein NTW59_05200 [Candidatus Diapherotrites archaeon]|nr:hypothetical protein [Candidatus Diapherotrites archaeon]